MELFESTIVYIDGACEPHNPGGHMGWGVWCREPELRLSGYAPPHPMNSNNVAEYRALVEALRVLRVLSEHIRGPIEIRSDSQLLVKQMSGMWDVNKGRYVDTYREAMRLYAQYPSQSLIFHWVPREANTAADELSHAEFRSRGIRVPEHDRRKPRW